MPENTQSVPQIQTKRLLLQQLILDGATVSHFFQEDRLITFQHFLLAVSHHMDVLNADELELYVGVIVFIFVAFSRSPVCDRVQLERHMIIVRS